MNYILYYLATIFPLIFLDAIWILFVAKDFYAEKMSFLFNKNINTTPIIFFYPIYALAVLLLVVLPAVESGDWVSALWRGLLLGLASYAAYDLTNQATILNWPTIMTIVDIGWGAFVTGITSLISYFIIIYFK